MLAIFVAAFMAAAPPSPLEAARDKQDREALTQLAAQAGGAADKAPNDAEAQYRAALANSYLAEVMIEQHDRKGGRQIAERGIRFAEKTVAMKPGNAEYYRLLGTLYGQAITDIMSGLTYGPKARDAINKAVEKAPRSSMMYVARGVGNYYVPAQLGGGAKLAIPDFQKAIELDRANAEAWLWLGLSLRKENRDAEARQAFAKSLELNPNRVWTKQQLEKTPGEMKPLATAAASVALALLTFFQFPGHTWLQQDSQIYVPILEHLRDRSVLRNDILVQHPPVAFTLYDETTLALSAVSGAGFREVLAAQQIAARALGIWGLLLMAESLGLAFGPALLVAAICSLGALIPGAAVLTFEYEPTPRAFAIPMVVCAIGLAAQRRHLAAGIAAAIAFLYHPPSALPFWGVYFVYALWPSAGRRARLAALLPLAAAAALLGVAASAQSASSEAQHVFARLDAAQEFLQRLRTAYVWISAWPAATIAHHLLILAILLAAFVRIRQAVGVPLRVLWLGLAAVGALTMPLSWLLLEQFHWGLVPQVQPMRALLFLTLGMQFLTAAAGARALVARSPAEAIAWLSCAYLLPLQPLLTGPFVWNRIGLALALAALTAVAGIRWAPAAAVAAFFAIPMLGGVVNYPRLHTPDLAQLSAWARANTDRDAVFVFPGAGRSLAPGIFRSEALRAIYVDWKGGGQVNYLKDLGEQWWFRWQQTRDFRPADLPQYAACGIGYVVLAAPLPRAAQFQNASYVVYQLK